ncbi:FecR domain-containing protein [Sphingomonas sp. 28-63-12]|uniref:FecR family protein n=1 Tax=Sphingomonas sp. 28-63-12 TaxID=1970434 RepID=UPI0035A941A0
MSLRLTLISAATMAALLPVLAPGGAHAQTVGANAAVVNDVAMTTQAQPARHRAVVKERVSLGNNIDTGKASRLQVLLLDRTVFALGSNSRIKVDRFVYDPSRQASAVGLSVARGTFRFMSSRALHASPGQSSISTPIATIGVRGTIVEGAVGADALRIAAGEAGLGRYTADPAAASLILLRGPGPNAQGGATPGAIDVTVGGVTLSVERPGYALFAPGAGQPLIGPFLLSSAGSALLSDMLGLSPREIARDERNLLRSNPVVDDYFEKYGRGQQTSP